MKYEQLIQLTEELIRSYNPVTLTVDSHFDQFIKEHGKKFFDTEVMFLKQVFSGVLRYEQFLKILTKALFQSNSSSTNRNDSVLYHIFGYLIIFRLDELPFTEFRRMLVSQNPVKINVFLQFLFDIPKIEKLVYPEWIELYDPDYIQNQVIGGLESHIQLMKDLLDQICEKATGKRSDLMAQMDQTMSADESSDGVGKQVTNKQKKAITTSKPFKLTEPKIRVIPEPIMIPKNIKSRPIPKSINQQTLNQIEEDKQKRKEEIKQKLLQDYKESKQQPFEFQTEKEKPGRTNKDKTNQQQDDIQQSQNNIKRWHPRPAPNWNEMDVDVKLNAAAIFRDEMLLQKKLEIEKNRLQAMEINLRDSTEFDEWQREMREKDLQQQLEHYQRKKIEMEQARESAMKAQEDKFQQNKIQAHVLKQELQVKMKEREEQQREEIEHKRKLIETVMEGEKNGAIEKERIAERNKKIADDTKLEMAKLIERKKLEDEQIRLKKEELIKQLRELEKQPRKLTNGYDPTETMGLGLLEEMSLAELRERLDQVREQEKQEEENKRKENALKKDEYMNSIQKKVNDIKQHRDELKNQNQLEREQKKMRKQKEQQMKQEIREQQELQVQEKLRIKKKQKQDEELRIAKEAKETKLKQYYINATKAMVDENGIKSLQDENEKDLKERQNQKLIDATARKERLIIANAAKTLIESKLELYQEYDNSLKKANQEQEEQFAYEQNNKKYNYNASRDWQNQHKNKLIERDNYKYKLSQMSLENSKKLKNQRSNSAKQKNIQLPSAQYPPIKEVQQALEI